MFSSAQYDIFITAPGMDITRRAALPRLVNLYKLDRARQEALARGERILLRSKVDDAAAQRIVNDLRALGFQVDIEARNTSLEAVGIDGGADEPAPRPAPTLGDSPLFNVSAGLVGLDGDDEPAAPSAASSTTGVNSLLGLFGTSAPSTGDVLVEDEPAPKPAPRRVPPPPIAAPISVSAPMPPPPVAAPTPVAADLPQRFRPASLDDEANQLTLDRAPLTTSQAEMDAAAASDTVQAPRCPTHDVEKVRGRCPQCDAEEAYVKSRLMGGTLRRKPQLRTGIGVGAGLLLGWILTAPMSRHGDMRVQDLREQAQRERERPTEEGHARAAQLDADADDVHQADLVKTFGIWGLVTAAVTALWLKLT